MKNEPVAYLMVERNDGNSYIQMGVPTRDEKISHQPYPLYTHPVKELTDEEIANTWDDVRKDATLKSSMKDIQEFARAILRKAQEK